MIISIKKTLQLILLSIILIQVFSLFLNFTFADESAAVIEFSDEHSLIVTSTDVGVSIEEKAEILSSILAAAEDDRTIILVFPPTDNNASYYKNLKSLIAPAVDAAELRGVEIRVQFVNEEIAAAASEASWTYGPQTELYYSLENSGVIYVQNVPENLVEKLDRNRSIVSNLTESFRDLGDAALIQAPEQSFSGITLATMITATGAATLGPSWVYVDYTREAAVSFALSTALLYTIPRNEIITEKFYELGYESFRSATQFLSYAFNQINFFSDRKWFLPEKNPLGFDTFRVAAATAIYSMPLQMAFYSLQDGSAIWNPEYLEYMFRNSILIGAASAPWSFATKKIKEQTHVSKNLVTHLRTAQLLSVGMLTATIPYGIETEFFALNSVQEAILVGMGGLGLLANKFGVRIVNKIEEKVPLTKKINKFIQAVTDSPSTFLGNIMRRLSGRRTMPYGFFEARSPHYHAPRKHPHQANQCLSFLSH